MATHLDAGGIEGRKRDRVVGGSFAVGREIGRGAFGVVYEGVDLTLDRPVALKLVLPGHSSIPVADFKAFTLKEARAAAKVNHPNVVTVYNVVDEGDELWIAMELCEGETLASLLARERVLPPPRAVAIAVQVLLGLHAAHLAGIVHRDVKPANVMVSPDGSVKLMDFGIARIEQPTSANPTLAGLTVGTPNYMAPEQVRGGTIDARTDVWAAAAVLQEMLTGHPPFEGANQAEVLVGILRREPALVAVTPEIPVALSGAVWKAMRKDPDKRHGSARAFAEALGSALPATGPHERPGVLAPSGLGRGPTPPSTAVRPGPAAPRPAPAPPPLPPAPPRAAAAPPPRPVVPPANPMPLRPEERRTGEYSRATARPKVERIPQRIVAPPAATAAPATFEGAVAEARAALDAGDGKRAEGLLAGLVTRPPREPEKLAALGSLLFRCLPGSSANRERVLGLLREALARDPSCLEALLVTGRILRLEGQLEESADALRRASRLAPGDADVAAEVAKTDALRQRQAPEAQAHTEPARPPEPDPAPAPRERQDERKPSGGFLRGLLRR